MTAVAPEVIERRETYATAFAGAQPFRHVVIDGFLERELAHRLLATFPRFEDRYALNEMGAVGGKAVREHVRDLGEAFRLLDEQIQSPAFLDLVSHITGIPDLLYDPHYVGGGTHENVHGQSLDPHVDFNYHPGTRWHRRLNLIVYLNPEWEDAWGGLLELHSDPWRPAENRITRVPPLMNRCVIFETTESSWHGFEAIALPDDRRALSRKSFAIYLYTRERPPEQTAPAHATIYVPDGRPRELVPGVVLDEAAIAKLDARFHHFRGQLRFLYTREQHFARQIANLEYALDEARNALRLPLVGHARQSAPPEGFWPDAWAGRQAGFRFQLVRPAKRLVLEAWTPDRLVDGQVLVVTINGVAREHALRAGRVQRLELALPSRESDIAITLAAQRTWSPKQDGGGDERELAWRLVSATVE